MRLKTVQKLTRMGAIIIQEYRNGYSKMYAVIAGLVIRARVLRIEIPILLLRPENVPPRLKHLARYPPMGYLFGDVDIREYVYYPSLGKLCGSASCLIDY